MRDFTSQRLALFSIQRRQRRKKDRVLALDVSFNQLD
jgi:hypothetical protein